MAFVITSACKNEKASECVEVCPVDAIHPGSDMYYINPDVCIDCGACLAACPVEAVYYEEDVPEEEMEYISKNREFFLTGQNS